MNINIRQENENDYASAYNLVQTAFANAEYSDGDEQNLVYYPRFGYKLASVYGIKAPFPVSDENLMAIKLIENYKSTISGTISYAKEFFRSKYIIHDL